MRGESILYVLYSFSNARVVLYVPFLILKLVLYFYCLRRKIMKYHISIKMYTILRVWNSTGIENNLKRVFLHSIKIRTIPHY